MDQDPSRETTTVPRAPDHTASSASQSTGQQGPQPLPQRDPSAPAPQAAAQAPVKPSAQGPAPQPAAPKEGGLKTLLTSTTAILTALATLVAALTALLKFMNEASLLPKPAVAVAPAAVVSAAAPAVEATATQVPTTALIVAMEPSQSPSPSPFPTDTPEATAVPTPTATPEPTATPSPTPVTQGVLVREDFHLPSSTWGLVVRSDYQIQALDGELQIRVAEADTVVWIQVPGACNLADVAVEVDARQVSGSEDGYFGITVREGIENYMYLFAISADGWFQVQMLQSEEWVQRVPWTESAAIRQDGAVNRLRVGCLGADMYFYVNGELVTQIHDATYPFGCVGLLAGSAADSEIDVRYDNLLVEVKPNSP